MTGHRTASLPALALAAREPLRSLTFGATRLAAPIPLGPRPIPVLPDLPGFVVPLPIPQHRDRELPPDIDDPEGFPGLPLPLDLPAGLPAYAA